MTNRVNVHKSITKQEIIIPFTEPSNDTDVHRRGAEIRIPKDITTEEIILTAKKLGWYDIIEEDVANHLI